MAILFQVISVMLQITGALVWLTVAFWVGVAVFVSTPFGRRIVQDDADRDRPHHPGH